MYKWVPMAIGSLLDRHRDAEVYFFCEHNSDDEEVKNIRHPQVKIVNINTLEWPILPTSPNSDHPLTKFTMVRCFLPDYLTVDRCLWLDVDTLVFDKIDSLYNMDMGNNFIAGALDFPYMQQYAAPDDKKKYINAGVLLMNLKLMREYNISQKLADFLNTTKVPFIDQDALNTICYPRIKTFHHEYNYGQCAPTEYLKTIQPKIMHFAGPKLWNNIYVQIWRMFYKESLNYGEV